MTKIFKTPGIVRRVNAIGYNYAATPGCFKRGWGVHVWRLVSPLLCRPIITTLAPGSYGCLRSRYWARSSPSAKRKRVFNNSPAALLLPWHRPFTLEPFIVAPSLARDNAKSAIPPCLPPPRVVRAPPIGPARPPPLPPEDRQHMEPQKQHHSLQRRQPRPRS
jgi:hypothetical protein